MLAGSPVGVCCTAAVGRLPAGTVAVKTKKNIHFEFDQDLVREPLLYKINRSFDVVVNIRGASVTDQGGFIALELEGDQAEVERVLAYLRQEGVKLGEGLGGQER
ncbi:MAG: NIL domain-containing protein [Planctomycetes bacterium]|nr:NIL domain-containing protein [Planctomycetota bacterium]